MILPVVGIPPTEDFALRIDKENGDLISDPSQSMTAQYWSGNARDDRHLYALLFACQTKKQDPRDGSLRIPLIIKTAGVCIKDFQIDVSDQPVAVMFERVFAVMTSPALPVMQR